MLWRAVRGTLLAVAALVVFIEEFGWRPLAAFVGRLALWPPIARLESRIRTLSPNVALVLFLAPAALLFPVKIAALSLINHGRVVLGATVIVAAKLLGTALAGRLFVLVEPQLRRFAWFVRALDWWHRTKALVRAWTHRTAMWRMLRGMRCRWRRWRRRMQARERAG